jgi:DnaJ-class molecular chaperone
MQISVKNLRALIEGELFAEECTSCNKTGIKIAKRHIGVEQMIVEDVSISCPICGGLGYVLDLGIEKPKKELVGKTYQIRTRRNMYDFR